MTREEWKVYNTIHKDAVNASKKKYKDKVKHLPEYKYKEHRQRAKQRGIPFELTFDEWYQLWDESGQWLNSGTKAGQYVMCRTGDTGPYAVGNVRIDLHVNNIKEALAIRYNLRKVG